MSGVGRRKFIHGSLPDRTKDSPNVVSYILAPAYSYTRRARPTSKYANGGVGLRLSSFMHMYSPTPLRPPRRELPQPRRCTLKTIRARLGRRTSTEYAEKSLSFIIRACFRNTPAILTVITAVSSFVPPPCSGFEFIVFSDQGKVAYTNPVVAPM